MIPDAATPTRSAAPDRRLRVLIADDYDVFRGLIRRALDKLGHDAHEASDGQEAVEALATDTFDLLLLDLSMPRMGGIEVVRWLNANPHRAEGLTIVVISASAREERPILNELGVDRVLPKPFRRQELADLVASLS